MSKFREYNANPWGKHLPDCSVRALSLALNISYKEICKLFKAPCKDGSGLALDDGLAEIDEIIRICNKKHFIVNSEVDNVMDAAFKQDTNIEFDGYDYVDPDDLLIELEAGITIDEFCDMYPPAKFILFVRPTKAKRLQGDKEWHATYLDNGPHVIYDTWDCRRGTLVFGWMQINPEAVLDDSDRKSRVRERQVIRGQREN